MGKVKLTIPISTGAGLPALKISDDSWAEIEAEYGYPLIEGTRRKIIEATREYLSYTTLEINAVPVSMAIDRIKAIKTAAAAFHAVMTTPVEVDLRTADLYARHLIADQLRVRPANVEVVESSQNAFNFGEGLRSFLAVEAGTKNAREKLRSLAREVLGVVRACDDALRQPERLASIIHDDAETSGIQLTSSEIRTLVADHSALHLRSRGFSQKEGWNPWICRIAEICRSTGLPIEARKDTHAPKTRKDPAESPFVNFIWRLQQNLPGEYRRPIYSLQSLAGAISDATAPLREPKNRPSSDQ